MPGFDIKTAVPIMEDGSQKPEFDINTALQITSPVDGEDSFQGFQKAQFHQQIKDNINRPLSAGEVKFIQDTESQDPGALRSFLIPYTEGVVGFFTKPFGYRPDLSKPFGLKKGAKTTAEKEEEAAIAKSHPVAFTLGQIVAGTAPFIAAAPLFPQTLLGTLATFETVGLAGELGRQRADESLMMPTGERIKAYGREAVKSGILAPVWFFSGGLRFIGRPFLSAMTRAGARGTATVGLEAAFGADLEQALKQGGIITALSLMFEAPALAKTALGRGILNRANTIMNEKYPGFKFEKTLPEQKAYDITKKEIVGLPAIDTWDQAATRINIFDLIKGLYSIMRTKLEKGPSAYDRMTCALPKPPSEAPGEAGGVIWAPRYPTQPKAGGMAIQPQKAPIFYSKMAAALAEKMPESAPVEQVRGILQSAQIPREEIGWSGIEEFLKGKDKIGKTELLDYLSKNQLTIEETIRGGNIWRNRLEEIAEEKYKESYDNLTQKQKDDVLYLIDQERPYTDEQLRQETKYADPQYNVVTENYKEILLKVPTPDLTKQIAISEKTGKWDYSKLHEGIYKEPHWEEPNVFAHARIADVTDAEGKKGLFINEIQSQWALEGRKQGFAAEELLPEHLKIDDSGNSYMITAPNGRNSIVLDKNTNTKEDAINKALDYFKELNIKKESGAPYHPVVSRWHEVILKRLLRYAAENGYDFITWATGEQVAEYYDLSKQVDEIKYKNFGAPDGFQVDLIKDNTVLESKAIENPEALRNFVGKDIAQKIIDGKKSGTIKGKELKVSPEWSKNLYDRQIPNWLNDYAKKFGAQVENINLGIETKLDRDLFIQETGEGKFGVFTKEELEKLGMPEKEFDTEKEAQAYIDSLYQTVIQQSLTITPQMKQVLLGEGQPVFGKAPKDIGKPGLETGQMKIFRMDEEMRIVNTKGEIVTLPKGEEYRTLPVIDAEGNVVPNKVKLQDGKQITVFEGELNKLKGKILGGEEQPIAGGMAKPPVKQPHKAPPTEPEGEEPKGRPKERKENMILWNTPDITSKLNVSEQEFIKKYIDENKPLRQIAKELGEDIEDVKKTEKWVYAHMQEMADEAEAEMREGMERVGDVEFKENQARLKGFLQGKLKPELQQEGEYSKLKLLPWIWAEPGKGVRADDLTELSAMGFPVENSNDIIALIENYFDKEIQGRAETLTAQHEKARRAEAKRMATAKPKKVETPKPERQITGVGNGSVISGKEDIDFEERAKIFKGMPFSLLGNKAEILSRLTKKLKAALKQGIKKVYDLFGGAKGYRSGLFAELPAADYNLNELSDERHNYYKNVQDPEKQKIMKQALAGIMDQFTAVMKEAFDLPPAKDNLDFLNMLNSWLKMGLKRERYYFAREIIQEFGDKLLQEAIADNFASPESSAKYYFLENTTLFSLSKTEAGYKWTQGIIRTTQGESAIRNILDKIVGFAESLDAELKRDQSIMLTQQDAWETMDKLIVDIQAKKVNPKEIVVLVDPQYLNPTEKTGTYSVGASDTSWEGHKANLEKHLLPLIKTGAKIIYTNNADQNLIKWLQAHRLPYNLEEAIGAMAERSGRDEIVSFIGFDLGPEWTMGRVQPAGAGALEPGQQYVAPRVTGQSARFTEWLKKREEVKQQEAVKGMLLEKISQIATKKQLSKITVSRIKKYLGIKEIKNTGVPEIQKLVDYVEELKTGDKLLSEKQIQVLQQMFGEIKDIAIMPKRIAIDTFGESGDLLEGLITSHITLELLPTVDIKEGNRAVTNILNSVNEKIEHAEEEIRRRDNQLDEMIRKAQKARAVKLSAKERIIRGLIKQDKEIFMALSGEEVELTPEETAVVAYLKNFFAMVKERLALKKYRANYVTHLEQPLMEKIANKGIIGAIRQYFKEQEAKEGIPVDIMLELNNIIGSEKFFRFALKRKGGIEPTTNIQKIVHDYSSLFETKVALDQILPEGQVVTKLLLQGKSALWLKKFLQNLKGRGLDNEFRTGRMGWLVKVADGIVDIGYVKLLSLNWRSAVKNLVAGEANAIIWQDFSEYLEGKKRFSEHPKKAYEIAVEHGVLEGTYADYSQRGIGKLKKVQDWAMMGQKGGEIEIRTCMFCGELTEKEWETGEISPARSRELRDHIAITQGVFSKTESPLWVQSILGRTIMQMNRWRITDAMLLRRIVNGAKEEWSHGNYKGKNSFRLLKALLFYGIGMYVGYELRKAGFKKAAQIAQSMAEVVNSLISLISQGDLSKMVTDNPTISVLKEFFFTLQEIAKYIHIPGAQKPSTYKVQQGIEETYMAPLNTVKDIIDELQ